MKKPTIVCLCGSTKFKLDMLEPAFVKSTGHLIALCVWEGGDSINRLEVHDGSISWTDIEI